MTVFWGASWSETTGLSPASWLCTRDWSCRTPLGYWTHRWETSVQRHPSSLCSMFNNVIITKTYVISCCKVANRFIHNRISLMHTTKSNCWSSVSPVRWILSQLPILMDGFDISAAFTVSLSPPSVSDERKEASRPKRKFLAGDVRKMHDILSKNMYKIRQKVSTTAEKHF